MTTELDHAWTSFGATLRPSTALRYRSALNNYGRFRGATTFASLDAKSAGRFVEWLRGRGFKKSYVRFQMTALRAFVGWAVRAGIATANPFADLNLSEHNPHDARGFLRWGEAEAALEDVRGRRLSPRDRALFTTMLHTGGLSSKVGALTVSNLDLLRGRLRLRNRWRAMSPALIVELKHYEPWRQAMFRGSKYVFPSSAGKALTSRKIWQIARSYAFRFDARELRDAFAVHELSQGTPLLVVRDLLGHRGIESTAQYLPPMGLIDTAKAMAGSLKTTILDTRS